MGKSGYQWKHVKRRVFLRGVFGIANSLQNVAHSQKLWPLSGRSVGTVTTWLGVFSRQPAWWHGCYRKEQFCGFQIKESCSKTTKKNTQFVGVQTTKKKTVLWGTQWGQWKTTAKIHFDHYLRGFWGGYCTHLIFISLFLYSFIWLYLIVFSSLMTSNIHCNKLEAFPVMVP